MTERRARYRVKIMPKTGSVPEELFAFQLKAAGIPTPKREFLFARPRRWRFDFSWPDRKLALEVEGGLYTRGRHIRPAGYEADCEKYNEAALIGWRVLRVTSRMVRDGRALQLIERVFANG